MFGSFEGKSSNVWKFSGKNFQGLELCGWKLPKLGTFRTEPLHGTRNPGQAHPGREIPPESGCSSRCSIGITRIMHCARITSASPLWLPVDGCPLMGCSGRCQNGRGRCSGRCSNWHEECAYSTRYYTGVAGWDARTFARLRSDHFNCIKIKT